MHLRFSSRARYGLAAGLCALTLAGTLAGSSASATTPSNHIFSTTLAKGTNVTISPKGLVEMFTSPFNNNISVTHLGFRDTYLLCDVSATYYESVFNGATGFGPPITSSSGSTFTVVRTTTDKRYKLSQVFGFDAPARRVTVAMTVTNLTNTTLKNVRLRRWADFDVDAMGTNAFGNGSGNNWARTHDAVIAWDDMNQLFVNDQPHGMILSGADNPLGKDPKPEVTNTTFPKTCTSSSEYTPAAGINSMDAAAGLFYNLGTIASGKSMSVTIAFQRI